MTNFSDPFESVRVIDEVTAAQLAGVSPRTWDRMRYRGETPPITRIRMGAAALAKRGARWIPNAY